MKPLSKKYHTLQYTLAALLVTGIPAILHAAVPTDPNSFLTFLDRYVPEDATSTQAYYTKIDPASRKTTYGDWLFQTGFINNPLDFLSEGAFIENADVSVTYQNVSDLGFIRRVRARCNPSCKDPNPDIYATIENYPTFDDAAARTNRLAAVTLEWSAAADGSNPSLKFVTFYAYTGTIDPLRFTPNMRNDLLNGVPFAPNLDGRGSKSIPGLCNSCHGGAPQALNADGSYPNNGFTGALFLPADLDNFAYDPNVSRGLSKAQQEAEFKKMNKITLITHRGTKKFDEVAKISRLPAGHELIEGWYGGAGMPSPTFNKSFVPKGWLPPAAPVGVDKLYLEAVAPACRACHMQQKRDLDFATYKGFMAFKANHKNLVLAVECGPNTTQAVMPLALLTYNLFWQSNQINVFKQFLPAVNCANW